MALSRLIAFPLQLKLVGTNIMIIIIPLVILLYELNLVGSADTFVFFHSINFALGLQLDLSNWASHLDDGTLEALFYGLRALWSIH